MRESLQWGEIWRNFAFDKREQAAPQHRANSLHSVCTVLASEKERKERVPTKVILFHKFVLVIG